MAGPKRHGEPVASKSLTEFHLFSRLPPELRVMIWKMAIIHHLPARIHYYSLFNEEQPGHRNSYLPWLVHKYGRDQKPGKQPSPQPLSDRLLRTDRSQFGWTQANRLGYYWNAGLRTACWESRIVLGNAWGPILKGLLEKEQSLVKKRRRVTNRKPAVTKKPTPMRRKTLTKPQIRKRRREIAAGRTVVPIIEDSSTIYMDYSPRDIVCFRFAPEHLAACRLLDWRQLFTHLPFYQLPQAAALNVGFEFKDGWEKGLDTLESVRGHIREDSVRGLILRLHWAWSVGEVPILTRIFLINPRKDLPDHYLPGQGLARRYDYDLIYKREYNCERKPDLSFFDGKQGFVHSSSWDDYKYHGEFRDEINVPICKFIRNVDRFCRPQAASDIMLNLPDPEIDRCLVVLRHLSRK